jgi:hypothetical protein
LAPVVETDVLFTVRIESRSPDFVAAQQALIEDFATKVDAVFGHENVTRHVAPDPGGF